MKTPAPRSGAERSGFSLVEVMVVISILGVVAAMAMVMFSGYTDSAREAVVRKQCEEINRGLKTFSQAMWDITTPRNDASTDDELKVLHTIQYIPTNGFGFQPGAPFYTQQWNPTGGNNPTDFRLRWTGSTFEILKPGMTGSGLKIARGGADYQTTFTYPADYRMEGDPRALP